MRKKTKIKTECLFQKPKMTAYYIVLKLTEDFLTKIIGIFIVIFEIYTSALLKINSTKLEHII